MMSPMYVLKYDCNETFKHKKTNLKSREITYVYLRKLFVFVRFVRFLLVWGSGATWEETNW